MDPVIGIDFDNTIIRYDAVLFRLAVQRQLVPPTARPSKKYIRDQIRTLPDGDVEWQRLQAILYGPAMAEAVLADGVAEFIRNCRRRALPVYIVSHKTARSNLGGSGVNFRDAADHWMRDHGFFRDDGLGLRESDVFYEATRREKVARIVALGCTHFIDDLEETFLERTFPSGVTKILYNPHGEPVTVGGVRVCTDWDQIGAGILS
jgi:hypothetical protein